MDEQSIRILVVSDVDIRSAVEMVERFVPNDPQFTACLVCGPFTNMALDTKENEAAAQGDMSYILSLFENIVCRVVYVGDDADPLKPVLEQINLTPNSVNIHARSLQLLPSLTISGVCERSDIADSDMDGDCDDITVQSSLTKNIIDEVLQAIIESSAESTTPSSGIFALNYKYLHTLNQFLFFSAESLHKANVILAVIPSKKDSAVTLPAEMNGMSIVAPKSLRDEGSYAIVELKCQQNWSVSKIEYHKLDL